MIICENKTTNINRKEIVNTYSMFEVWIDDEHKYLYKRVVDDSQSENVTYMQIWEHLGKTTFDFCTFRRTMDFATMVEDFLGYCDGYIINKISKMKFSNLSVIYSY